MIRPSGLAVAVAAATLLAEHRAVSVSHQDSASSSSQDSVSLSLDEWMGPYLAVSRAALAESQKLRNFTCQQTTFRTHYPRTGRPFSETRTIEAGIVNGKEAFGFPGGVLSADIPSELGGYGVSTTGEMYQHTRAVVAFRKATVRSATRRDDMLVFDFQAGSMGSDFLVHGKSDRGVPVSYHGQFAADPITRKLRWLRLTADDMPTSVPFRRIRVSLLFPQGKSDVSDVLPIAALTEAELWTGAVERLETHWSNCAEYGAISVISFDDADRAPQLETAQRFKWLKPVAQDFLTELTEPLDLPQAVLGDPVSFRLVKPLELPSGDSIPAGTPVIARLAALQDLAAEGTRVLGFRFEAIADGMTRVLFSASPIEVRGLDAARPQTRSKVTRREWSPGSFSDKKDWQATLLANVPGLAQIVVPKSARRIPRSLTIRWRVESTGR